MNHYERLKVSQDAPAEVIRAAYRALAAKLHPDRQGPGPGGPEDAHHTQMAALNAAYEVLIDPKLRREYDATLLAPSRTGAGAFGATFTGFGAAAGQAAAGAKAGLGGLGIGAAASPESDADEPSGPSTRVDLNWLPPGVATTATPLWPPSRRMMLIGGSALALLIVGGSGVMWQVMGHHKMERAMSNQYSTPAGMAPPAREGEPPALAEGQDLILPSDTARRPAVGDATADASGKHRPSVEELARMSDEELLRVLPTLGDDHPIPQKALRRIARQHPLDGKPLSLRTESHMGDAMANELGAPPPKDNRKP